MMQRSKKLINKNRKNKNSVTMMILMMTLQLIICNR